MVQDRTRRDWTSGERIVNTVSDAIFYTEMCTITIRTTIVCNNISIARIVLCLSPLGMREQAISLADPHIFRKQRARNEFHCNSKQQATVPIDRPMPSLRSMKECGYHRRTPHIDPVP